MSSSKADALRLAEARDALARFRAALQSPPLRDSLETALPQLALALQSLPSSLPPELQPEAAALTREVRLTGALLGQLGSFHVEWIRGMSELGWFPADEYTESGARESRAPLVRRISLEG
jgi:hypothetical protein